MVGIGAPKWGGGAAGLQPPLKTKFKKINFRRHNDIKGLLDLRFSLNQPLNTLRTGLLNCLNACFRGLIQSEVRFL